MDLILEMRHSVLCTLYVQYKLILLLISWDSQELLMSR